MSYEGKEICQGCKKPGTEVPRPEKNSLCPRCAQILNKGNIVDIEDNTEYIGIAQHFFAYRSLSFNDNTLNEACIELLKSIDNPYKKPITWETLNGYHGDNRIRVIIPLKFYKPLQMFLQKMSDYVGTIREEKENIPNLASKAIQAEKDKIYNAGIEKGRSLLFQLNSGDISANELNNNYSYNEKTK